MKEIFKNVRNKLAEKYLDNNSLKNSKKFKPRIKARIRKNKQIIKVFKKELTYNQLMSIVDDIEKIRNKTLTKCSKAKSEPVIRARTALENEFIEPAISRETFNQCEILQKKATDLIDLITQKRIKEILGKINFEKYINEKI